MLPAPCRARPPLARLAGLLFAFALIPAGAHAEYRTLETDHMRLIYFSPTQRFIATYTAKCFENAFRFHSERFQWAPSEKVLLILDDHSDYGNAAAWATPKNGILVYLAPVNFVYETGPGNERIHFVMNHELAHVVTLDQAAGTDRFFRGLFMGKVRETAEHPETIAYGFLTTPRRAAPKWHREGTAVFLETWMSGGLGRAQGPWDEMVFRAMVRDGTPFYDPLGLESEGMKVDFQAGVNAYLYGTRFSTYLADHYGPEQFMRWVSRGPGSRAHYANQFRAVFGTSLTSAWRDWVASEHAFQRANLDSVRRYPTTPYRDLSPRPLGSVSRAVVDSATRTLYAGVFYPGEVAHVTAIPLDGGPSRSIHEVRGPALYFVTSLAWDPESRTILYTADNNEWRDLCALDPDTGRNRTLIRDARIGDLALNRADRSLWGVRHLNGFSTIVRLPYPWKEWNQIFTFPYGRDVYDIDISADGTRLVGSMGEVTGRHALRLWDLQSLARGDSTSRMLFDFGSSIPTSFVFDETGRAVYGSSYYTGVSNIFRYDLEADSLDIVSNAETGFFRPIPRGADSLIVFRFGGGGFVPAVIAAKPLQDVSAIRFFGNETVTRHPELKEWKTPSPATLDLDAFHPSDEAYRGLASVRVNSIVPIVEGYKEGTALGLFGSLSDPLSHHDFSLSGSYSIDSDLDADERFHATVGYRRGNIQLKLRQNPASFYDLGGPTKSSRKGSNASVSWSHTLVRELPRTIDLELSAGGWTGLERLPDYQNVETSPGFDKLLAHSIQLTGKNLRSSLGAVEHEKGYKWSLAYSTNGVRFVRGDRETWKGFPFVDGTADVGIPGPFPNGSVWLRTAAGYAGGARDEPFANYFFGGFGNNWVDHGEIKRYRELESFAGTELNAIAGTRFGKAMVDVNWPPLRFTRFGTPGLYASWLRVSTFGGALVANPDDEPTRRELANFGVQADLRLQLFTLQSFTLSAGWARALEDNASPIEKWMVSLKVL